jgi:hypothetical protein
MTPTVEQSLYNSIKSIREQDPEHLRLSRHYSKQATLRFEGIRKDSPLHHICMVMRLDRLNEIHLKDIRPFYKNIKEVKEKFPSYNQHLRQCIKDKLGSFQTRVKEIYPILRDHKIHYVEEYITEVAHTDLDTLDILILDHRGTITINSNHLVMLWFFFTVIVEDKGILNQLQRWVDNHRVSNRGDAHKLIGTLQEIQHYIVEYSPWYPGLVPPKFKRCGGGEPAYYSVNEQASNFITIMNAVLHSL